MAQTSRLVLEIDSRDAEQKAVDMRKALEGAEKAGVSLQPALKRTSEGMKDVGKSADEAAKSIEDERDEINALLNSINPLNKKMNELEAQEIALAKARKAGKIDLDTYNEYQSKITSTRNELHRFDDSLTRSGNTAKQTAAALRGVPAQFTDIAVSLQSGQAPLTVFLQQGGQLKDMFGGVGPAAQALGGYVAGLINPFTIAASAVGVFTLAAYKGYEQSELYRKALISTGDAAGRTADDLIALSGSIAGGRSFASQRGGTGPGEQRAPDWRGLHASGPCGDRAVCRHRQERGRDRRPAVQHQGQGFRSGCRVQRQVWRDNSGRI
ncbi:phage tail length tape measure family protein [Pseudomonas sp. TH10]|nr:phage tail length tape measure family protein [Pseudomonas sp. TH10]MBK5518427.1 phage tail length tape measure family protein [Pseudomonas sp. TH10]